MQDKSNTSNSRTKNILRLVLIAIVAVISIFVVSGLVMKYTHFFQVNFQEWFYQTRTTWFFWRVCLYSIVLGLMFLVNKHQPLPLKAKILIAFSIILVEGLNHFYLFN